MSKTNSYRQTFSADTLGSLFPKDRANRFFEALLGDENEGAYDITLAFKDGRADCLEFEFQLTPRHGKCLRCNLTWGLPAVFSRHPVIDVQGLVDSIEQLLEGSEQCTGWTLGRVQEVRPDLHSIPLTISIAQ